MKPLRFIESSGNVFADLGFPPDEAAILLLRAQLMACLRETLSKRGWTHSEAAEQLGIAQSRVADLVRGKHEKFSLEMLVRLTARTGQRVEFSVN